ncbi:unnamed protein product [Discula destructiva]
MTINTNGSSSTTWCRFWGLREHWKNPSPTAQHYGHVLLAILVFFIAQLLTCAWDQPFWDHRIDFPGQIVAMIFVWLFLWAVQLTLFRPGEGLERLHHRYLRAATEVLNKHMSIGFTIPFLSFIRQSFAGGKQVGLLTTAFAVTGLLSAIFVYAVAYYVQLRLNRLSTLWPHPRQHRVNVLDLAPQQRDHEDVELDPTRLEAVLTFPRHPAPCFPPSADASIRGGGSPLGFCRGEMDDHFSRLDRFRKHISDVSTLCTLSGYASDSGGANLAYVEERTVDAGRPEDALRTLESGTGATRPQPTSRILQRPAKSVLTWAGQNIFLMLSILIFLLIGLPLSSMRNNDVWLDIGFLFTVWLSFTSAQTRVKHQLPHCPQHKKSLTTIATLLNPVLWTSLFLLCYGLAKSHVHGVPTATVVNRFKTGTTVSDLIAHHLTTSSTVSPPFGAGDIATSILNAGIVSWGLKLFEYRSQILSRGGLTVLFTSALLAIFNIIAWPLLAHAIGVRPAGYDLSFAARSVTIALGGPAMASLGGDAGVNAVGVVVNGIVFQLVAGCFVGEGGFVGTMGRWRRVLRTRTVRLLRTGSEGASSGDDAEKTKARQRPLHERRHMHCSSDTTHVHGRRRAPMSLGAAQTNGSNDDNDYPPVDDVRTVAAGVTIGINAAAMGTAHLYEQNSQAAPYSALAMTTFGVFMVLFTVQSPMVEWLKAMVA